MPTLEARMRSGTGMLTTSLLPVPPTPSSLLHYAGPQFLVVIIPFLNRLQEMKNMRSHQINCNNFTHVSPWVKIKIGLMNVSSK